MEIYPEKLPYRSDSVSSGRIRHQQTVSLLAALSRCDLEISQLRNRLTVDPGTKPDFRMGYSQSHRIHCEKEGIRIIVERRH